jgi:hypothetical protein
MAPEEEAVCRICFQGAAEAGRRQGRLFRPCRCAGTQRFIHEGCLAQWRRAVPAHRRACPTCGYAYRYERGARCANSRLLAGVATATLVGAAVVAVALALRCAALLVARVALAVTARLLWWAVLAIGAASITAAFVLRGQGDVLGVAAALHFADGVDVLARLVTHWRGGGALRATLYSVGLLGFWIFCVAVWRGVRARCQVSRGDRVAEVAPS